MFKSTLYIIDYNALSSLWAKFKYESKKSFRCYVKRVEKSLKDNPIHFQKFVNNKRSCINFSKVMTLRDITTSNQ